MDPAFTSSMEEFDGIEDRTPEERVTLLSRFYKKFRSQLEGKKEAALEPGPGPHR